MCFLYTLKSICRLEYVEKMTQSLLINQEGELQHLVEQVNNDWGRPKEAGGGEGG